MTGKGHTLPFEADEFEARQAKVKQDMADRGLDAALIIAPENIYYLTGYETTGFHTFFQALVLTFDQQPVVVTRHLEAVNAEGTGYNVRGVGYQDKKKPGPALVAVLRELGLEGKAVGVEKDVSWFRVTVYEAMLEGMGRTRFPDCTGMVERIRAIKSPTEIGYMRKAAKATTAGALAAIDAIREGAYDYEVAAASFPARILADTHFCRCPTYVVSGPRSALAHQNWNGSRIEKGDVVYFEFGSNYRHYDAACMRTVSVGEPNDTVRRAADATLEGLDRAIAATKPGATAEEVHRANYDVLYRAGLTEYFRHRTGYGIGIEFIVWVELGGISVNWEDRTELRPGHCFHYVPLVLIPGVGGIGFSETVVVTEGGCEVLNKVPRELVIR